MEAVAEVKAKKSLSDLTYDQLATAREQLTAKIAEAEEAAKVIKAKREKLDAEVMRRFIEQGITNTKTNHGMLHTIKRESYSVGDKDVFLDWIKNNEALDFLEVRPAKAMVDTYKEEHEDLPPGINYSAKLTIGMRRS